MAAPLLPFGRGPATAESHEDGQAGRRSDGVTPPDRTSAQRPGGWIGRPLGRPMPDVVVVVGGGAVVVVVAGGGGFPEMNAPYMNSGCGSQRK